MTVLVVMGCLCWWWYWWRLCDGYSDGGVDVSTAFSSVHCSHGDIGDDYGGGDTNDGLCGVRFNGVDYCYGNDGSNVVIGSVTVMELIMVVVVRIVIVMGLMMLILVIVVKVIVFVLQMMVIFLVVK